jgi:hypothetical protein
MEDLNLTEMKPFDVYKNTNDGILNALQAAAHCRKMMAAWEACYKSMHGMILDQIQAYGKEKPRLYGCTFALSSTGNRYDYSKDAHLSAIESELKERKKLLYLASKSGNIQIVPDTGEEIQPLQSNYYASTTIVISIKQNEFADGIAQPIYSEPTDEDRQREIDLFNSKAQ